MLNTIELIVEVGTEQFMNPDLFIAGDGIAGDGAAGLVIAIVAADSGLSVVVSDTRYPPIDTACGKGLLPDAFEALPYLGVDLFFIRAAHFMASASSGPAPIPGVVSSWRSPRHLAYRSSSLSPPPSC
jgi:2-polyprenyl-6-methoxyphenol hydroxylase-like FAD-dependent oxidoreductase